MKAKHLIVLAALLVVAIIIAIATGGGGKGGEEAGGLAAGDAVLPGLAVNEVASFKITGDEKSVELERKGGEWAVKERAGYPADFGKLSRVLKALRGLEIAEARRAGASTYGRFELKAPAGGEDDKAGVLVEMGDGDGGELATLVLGKRYAGATDGSGRAGGGSGRYVRTPSNEGQVFIVSDSLFDIDPSPSSWLQRDFFRVEKHKDVTVGHPGGEGFKFSREEEGGDLALEGLADDEELNTTNTGTIASAFSSASFRDVVVGDAAAPEATGLDEPVTVEVTTFEGFGYKVKLGRKAPEGDAPEDGAADPAATKPKYYLSVEVDATLDEERVPGEDEAVADDASDEDKKKAEDLKKQRDEEFAAEKKRLEEKLEKEKAFAGTIYEIDSWAAEKFFKGRDELVKEKTEGGDTPPAGETPIPGAPIPGLPGATIPGVLPGASTTPGKPAAEVVATTPPVSVADALKEAQEAKEAAGDEGDEGDGEGEPAAVEGGEADE